jgi:hypothetical protein
MLFRIAILTLLLTPAVVACENGDGGDGAPASGSAAPLTLEEQLKSILLTDDEVPEGLEGADLAYSTNEQLAGSSEEELARLERLGRQLGVDLTFVPVSDVAVDSPARGGIQNSASVYVDNAGAASAFDVRSEAARTNDWPANYTDLTDVKVAQVDQVIGDETYWLRITGLDKCNPEEATPGTSPAPCPPARLAVIDHVLLRSGRTFIYLMTASDAPADAAPDTFAGQVEEWAAAVAGRAAQVFPPPG